MMASHYGVGVLPARPKRPRDKSKVENGVRFAQSCILGRLRNQTFFSLAEANAAIAQALDRINDHVMRRLGVSRRQLFESVERPTLAGLPPADYEFAEWRLARVSTDYHVEFKTFFYSVPHSLIRQQVDLRATARTIEIFHRGKRVAAHQRRYGGPRMEPIQITCPVPTGAMPNGHRSAFGAGPHPSDRRRKAWSSQSSPAVRIPSRAFEHVWASYACFATSIAIGPKPCQPALSRLVA
ncbi:hypothetical protein MPL1032_180109 [Mesorhizobium plurifarium]|uniref:Transposase for insertion sequence element IS21-like C-terminal domain-containing protein n=1 Tax=Mesorhizobium plurifarium TaxID=69974 RepID=A0A0K2VTN1_MESPL|nr:hypothetical protein MPL1032_180109 [Mesorhizobium plurifarium]